MGRTEAQINLNLYWTIFEKHLMTVDCMILAFKGMNSLGGTVRTVLNLLRNGSTGFVPLSNGRSFLLQLKLCIWTLNYLAIFPFKSQSRASEVDVDVNLEDSSSRMCGLFTRIVIPLSRQLGKVSRNEPSKGSWVEMSSAFFGFKKLKCIHIWARPKNYQNPWIHSSGVKDIKHHDKKLNKISSWSRKC